MSGMVTLPKLRSCCLRGLWGGLCWSQQPCLPHFLPKLFRSLRCLSPNAQCEHLWCGVWQLLLSCLQPQGKIGISASRGNCRDVEIQGLTGDGSGKDRLFSSLSWKPRICPIIKSPNTTITIIWHRKNHSVPAAPSLAP